MGGRGGPPTPHDGKKFLSRFIFSLKKKNSITEPKLCQAFQTKKNPPCGGFLILTFQ